MQSYQVRFSSHIYSLWVVQSMFTCSAFKRWSSSHWPLYLFYERNLEVCIDFDDGHQFEVAIDWYAFFDLDGFIDWYVFIDLDGFIDWYAFFDLDGFIDWYAFIDLDGFIDWYAFIDFDDTHHFDDAHHFEDVTYLSLTECLTRAFSYLITSCT